MMDQREKFSEIARLAALLCDGQITAAEIEALDGLLLNDPEAQCHYRQYMSLDVALAWLVGETEQGHVPQRDRLDPHATPASKSFRQALRRSPGSLLRRVLRGRHGKPATTARLSLVTALMASGIAALAVVLTVLTHGISGRVVRPESAQADRERSEQAGRSLASRGLREPLPDDRPSSLSPSTVARLSRVVDCRWADDRDAPRPGDTFGPGRELHVAAGVIELDFAVGVRSVVQGPARLDLLTPTKVFLYEGKISSEILKPAARGFEVRTSKGSIVDLGTEFGVEVTSAQDVQVHVFRGEVTVEEPRGLMRAEPAQHLLGNQGLRLEGDMALPFLVEDPGDTFIRNINNADRDRHVLAYWRFEDRPIGVPLPETGRNSRPVRATVDSSFNGNDLYSFDPTGRPVFSGDVPAPTVPQTCAVNASCLDNTQRPAPGDCRNVYTHSQFSHAAPYDLQKVTPAQWTVEASVRAAAIGGKVQTFLVRDAAFTQSPRRGPSRFVLQINARGRLAVSFFDVCNRLHEAVAEDLAIEARRWYHTAATSDGRTLRLYVDTLDGRGYLLQAATSLPAHGSTALGKGTNDAEWAVGRGGNESEDQVGPQFHGWIDEVRISDIARGPKDLLFAPK
jgi:hypothetical protein